MALFIIYYSLCT